MIATISLRPARLQDASLLMELIKAYYRFDEIPFHPGKIRPSLEALLRDASLGRIWIIQDGRTAVGYVVVTFGYDLEFGGRVATITDLYLRPEYRRQGLGTNALKGVERELRRSRVKTLELQVTGANKSVLAFYRKNGFDRHDRIPMSKSIIPSPQKRQRRRWPKSLPAG